MGRRKYRRRYNSVFRLKGNTMKSLPLILVMGAIVIGSIWAIDYNSRMAPSWATTEAVKNAQRLREAELKIERDREFTEWHNQYIGYIYGGLAISFFSVSSLGMWFLYHKRIEQSHRQIDGSYALQWRTVGGVKTLIDPNKLAGGIGALTVDNVLGSKPSFDNPEQQLRLLEQENRKRLMQAMPEQSIKYAAQAKLLAGAYDRPQRQLEYHVVEEEITPQPIVKYDLTQAINESDVDNWYVGQNPDDGHLYNLSINDVVHVGLVGATKTGKTSSTALLMMYYALKNRFLVIAFDGAGGVDWLPYQDYIEVYPVDYTTLPERVNQVVAIHERRMRKLQKLGVANIDEVKGQKVPHILVIFEEFGYMCQALEAADKKLFKETESKLSNLMRVSRKTGIHMLLVDQNPTRWSQVIKANVKLFIAYKLNGNLGGAINEYHLDKLKNKGQCSIENTFYDTWYTKGEINSLLKGLPKRDGALLKEVVTEPVTPQGGGITVKKEITPPTEITSYVTSYQGAEVVTDGSKMVTNASDVTSIENLVTTAITSKKSLLQGEPVTSDDKKLVYDVAQIVSKNKAYQALWGGKNGKRQEWLDSVLEEYKNG